MYLKTFRCCQIFLNQDKIKMKFISILFLLAFTFITGQQRQSAEAKELFTNDFLSNIRVHHVLKERLKKDKIIISDKDSLITNKPLQYSDDNIIIAINNKMDKADLYVKYYIINPDLAYAVFFKNTNEGISFIFLKRNEKWNFFDYNIRETR